MRRSLLCCLCVLAMSLAAARAAEREIIIPRPLEVGDTIALVAPASALDRTRVALCCDRLRQMGFKLIVPDDLFRRQGFLAGSDEARASELMQAFTNPEVDAIFPGTGGYGTTRILDQLDYEAIRSHPKLLVGFSDITALHVAIYQRAGLSTLHSPNPEWGLGSESNLTPFSATWFWRGVLSPTAHQKLRGSAAPDYLIEAASLMAAPVDDPERRPPRTATITPGIAQGRLVGGNLTVVHALMGTPFEIQTRDHILLLEDVGEAPYRIDRMLSTLRLAGKLDGLAGVVLGTFTRRANEDTSDDEGSIDDVLTDYFAELGVPVVRNFPIGHVPHNAAVPIGRTVELDATRMTLRVVE